MTFFTSRTMPSVLSLWFLVTLTFRGLLRASGKHGKMQVIVTFLAVLELMKLGKLSVRQDGTFGEIYMEAGEGLTGQKNP